MPSTIYKSTAASLIADGTRRLREAGVEGAARDARVLASAAFGMDAGQLLVRPDQPVSPSRRNVYGGFIGRRCAREPVSRILGEREFYGRTFEISPATLDPRPDSETLVEAALGLLESDAVDPAGRLRILDVGTGSGCLLITLLAELPNAMGVGTVIQPAALEMAERNAERLGVAGRVSWKLAQSLEGIDGPFDLMVANPPYIPSDEIAGLDPEVREHDPRAALDGGADGLQIYREIAGGLAQVVPRGWAVFEVGLGQAEGVSGILQRIAAVGDEPPQVRVFRDLNAIDRCVAWKARF